MNKKIIKICIFNPSATPSEVIGGNGDEILDTICTMCEIDEYLETGEYYLDGIFLLDDEGLWQHIQEESILKVTTDYGEEYFRIAKIQSTSRDISVFARQETIHQTLHMWLSDVRPEGQNGQGTLSWIKDNSEGPKDIMVSSDISKVSTAYYQDMNMYQALHDCDQSFVNRWGGEIQRRGYTLKINDRIGTHRGVQIRSNKNLTGFEANTNIDNVFTRLKPKGCDGITIDGYVDSPIISNYNFIKTTDPKYEDVKVKGENDDEGFDTLEQAQAELIRRAELGFSQNHIDKIKADYRVNFVQLEQTEEYKSYVQVERIYLGDEIDVYEEKHNINITVRAIRKRFDVLRQKTIEIELSNEVVRKKPPTISDILDKVDKVENNLNESNKWFENAINNATDLIQNGLKDSYVIHRKNEILIMDTTDINTAVNVWRWNRGGLGFSNTGYYGEYSTAITQDGSIVATMITSGILNASLLKTGVIRNHDDDFEINLDDGTIKVDGKSFKIIVDGIEEDVATSTQLEATKDGIVIKMERSGYDNKILNGRFLNELNHFSAWGNCSLVIDNGFTRVVSETTSPVSDFGIVTSYMYFAKGQKYSISFNLASYWNLGNLNYNYLLTNDQGNHKLDIEFHASSENLTYVTATFTSPITGNAQLLLGRYGETEKGITGFKIVDICLVDGDIPRPWVSNLNEINGGIVKFDIYGMEIKHEGTGNYSRMNSEGFLRYVNGTKKTYHYLTSIGTVNVSLGNPVTVQLPDEFKNKNFDVVVSAFKVNVTDNWGGMNDMDSFTTNIDRINGTFQVVGMVNSVTGQQGTLDISYTATA